jgi:hypothetical protein
VQKRLHQASETLEKARARSKAVGRKLEDVEEQHEKVVNTEACAHTEGRKR